MSWKTRRIGGKRKRRRQRRKHTVKGKAGYPASRYQSSSFKKTKTKKSSKQVEKHRKSIGINQEKFEKNIERMENNLKEVKRFEDTLDDTNINEILSKIGETQDIGEIKIAKATGEARRSLADFSRKNLRTHLLNGHYLTVGVMLLFLLTSLDRYKNITNLSKENDRKIAHIQGKIREEQQKLQEKIDTLNEHEDLCSSIHDCRGSLGFDRKDMPQITNESELNVLEDFIKSLPDYTIQEEVFTFNHKIKPIQIHVSGSRTAKICNAQLKDGARQIGVPIILVRGNTNNDIFILDGHHRAFAAAQCGLKSKLRVLVIENKTMPSSKVAQDIMDKLRDNHTTKSLFKGHEF